MDSPTYEWGNQFLFQIVFGSIASLNLPPECIRKRITNDNFGFAVICCLVKLSGSPVYCIGPYPVCRPVFKFRQPIHRNTD